MGHAQGAGPSATELNLGTRPHSDLATVTPFPRIGFWFALLVLLTPGMVWAEAPLPLGDTSGAMPGVERVGLPGVESPRLSLAATGSYGYTESQDGQDGANHRVAGGLAIGGAPLPWLEGALRLDGRYDKHPDDDEGSDDGMVGEPRLTLRAGNRAGKVVYGADATVWVIGGDAPSIAWDATTVDLKALFGYAPQDGPTIGVNVGWRLDQSANSEDEPANLRVGDRTGIGLSDSDALLLGLGLRYPVGHTELLGEVTADLLLGSDAPTVSESPMRIAAGARYWLNGRLAVSGSAEFSLSGRPDLGPTDPLVPIEPRAAVYLGLRYRAGPTPETTPERSQPDQPTQPDRPETVPDQPDQPPVSAPPPEPEVFEITGRVVDESGTPVPDAAVTLSLGELAEEYRTAADGSFRFEVEAQGEGTVAVESPGFDRVKRTVAVAGKDVAVDEVVLRPAVPAGELKGLIRGLDGKPVAAAVTVEGTEITLKTDAQGSFSVDVPPGSYVVQIEADGFVGQRRRVRIENRGVTVLNVDLRKQQ